MGLAPMSDDDQATTEGVERNGLVLAEAAARLEGMIALNESRIRQLRHCARQLDDLLDTVTLLRREAP